MNPEGDSITGIYLRESLLWADVTELQSLRDGSRFPQKRGDRTAASAAESWPVRPDSSTRRSGASCLFAYKSHTSQSHLLGPLTKTYQLKQLQVALVAPVGLHSQHVRVWFPVLTPCYLVSGACAWMASAGASSSRGAHVIPCPRPGKRSFSFQILPTKVPV